MHTLAVMLAVLALLAAVAAVSSLRRGRHQKRLRAIAGEAGFHYSPVDRFTLARRVTDLGGCFGGLPVRRVRDVMYQTVGARRRFVVTLEIEPMRGEGTESFVLCLSERSDELTLVAQVPADRQDQARGYHAAIAACAS